MRYLIVFFTTFFLCQIHLIAQTATNRDALKKATIEYKYASANNKQRALMMAKLHNWPTVIEGKDGSYAALMGISKNNHPKYYSTFNNTDVAATLNTNQLWSGGSTGLNLSGSTPYLKNKLAVWDGGRVRETHAELNGRVYRMDSSRANGNGSSHATHVTGTMIASGVNPLAKGMCNGIQGIRVYVFTLDNQTEIDIPEITGIASDLLVSNHSYGNVPGWYYGMNGWEWEGIYGDTVDYNFGYYSTETSQLDNIVYNAPYYLPVRAAGNSRNQNGPSVGSTYYYYDSLGNLQQGTRPANLSSNNSYGCMIPEASGKNIISVGAVYAIPNGYTQPSDVVMTPFSCWGPTNDGRIKPDLVSDGYNVFSANANEDSAYFYDSGTSMASPGVAGSLFLWQEYYAQLNKGNFMLAATLRGIAIHTANEAGDNPGPDYAFGWGLLNSLKAVEVIKNASSATDTVGSRHFIYQNTLNNGQAFSKSFTAKGSGPLKLTLAWTDPVGPTIIVDAKHPPTPELVNDLDIRVIKNGVTYYPWILNPYVPAAAATKGDNILDNQEQILIDSITKGDNITIIVSHKGSLKNNSQAYSLILSQPIDTIMPLKLISFTAALVSANNANITWKVTDEVNIKNFDVEISNDGIHWKTAVSASALNKGTYSVTDSNLAVGSHYFRLKIIEFNGSVSYSPVKIVSVGTGGLAFSLIPNPANTQTLLSFQKGINQATITIYDMSGKVVDRKDVDLQGSSSYLLSTRKYSKGIYTVSVHTKEGTVTNRLLIGKM